MAVSAEYLTHLFSLDGEVAFVTGGGGAVGSATARAFAKAGAALVLADKAEDAAQRVAGEIQAGGGRAVAIGMDVTREDSVRAAVDQATREFGKVDILVNNAGINIRKPAADLTPVDWATVMEVNLTGYFLCARAVGPGMIQRRSGRIINVASILGHRGSPISPNLVYTVSKGGVVNFTRALAVEWAPHNIRVNGVAPTYLRTPLTESFIADPTYGAKIISRTPMGRVGVAEDLAGAMLFLASRASDLVTGHILAVDGGWLAW